MAEQLDARRPKRVLTPFGVWMLILTIILLFGLMVLVAGFCLGDGPINDYFSKTLII